MEPRETILSGGGTFPGRSIEGGQKGQSRFPKLVLTGVVGVFFRNRDFSAVENRTARPAPPAKRSKAKATQQRQEEGGQRSRGAHGWCLFRNRELSAVDNSTARLGVHENSCVACNLKGMRKPEFGGPKCLRTEKERGGGETGLQEGGEKNAGKWKQGVNTPAKCYVSRQRLCVRHCREAPPRRASTITQQLPYSVGEEGAPGTIAPTITPNNYPKRRGKRPGDCWELNSKQLQRKSV